MMKHGMYGYLVVLAFTLALAAGCSEPGPVEVPTVSVSGTVTLDGKPLEGASVHFFRSSEHEGIGVTGPDGAYQLQAEVGENTVYFSKVEGLSEEEMEMAEMESAADIGDEEGEESEPEAGQVIPEKYNDPEKTEVTFDVPQGGSSNANFELTTQ